MTIIGVAFFDKGVFALAALFGHVEQHGRVACQQLQPGLSITIGVHSGFQETDGDGTLVENFLRPLHPFGFEVPSKD